MAKTARLLTSLLAYDRVEPPFEGAGKALERLSAPVAVKGQTVVATGGGAGLSNSKWAVGSTLMGTEEKDTKRRNVTESSTVPISS